MFISTICIKDIHFLFSINDNVILFSDPQDASDSEIALLNENPLFVLMEMMKVLHFRLVDLFHVLDKDNSRCISLDELKEGLEVCM